LSFDVGLGSVGVVLGDFVVVLLLVCSPSCSASGCVDCGISPLLAVFIKQYLSPFVRPSLSSSFEVVCRSFD
jgi:hypothetical protein